MADKLPQASSGIPARLAPISGGGKRVRILRAPKTEINPELAVALQMLKQAQATLAIVQKEKEEVKQAAETLEKNLKENELMLEQERLKTAGLQEENAKLKAQAERDPLTKLSNRRGAKEKYAWLTAEHREEKQKLQASGDKQKRNAGGSLFFVYMDLDDFKRVNDIHSHKTGDEVLKRAAMTFRQLLKRNSDIFFTDTSPIRLGGEEFAMIFKCDPVKALKLIEAGRAIFENTYFIIGPDGNLKTIATTPGQALQAGKIKGAFRVTLSVGVAKDETGELSFEEFSHFANISMKASKALGKNQIHCYDEKTGKSVPYSEALERFAVKPYTLRPDGRRSPLHWPRPGHQPHL